MTTPPRFLLILTSVLEHVQFKTNQLFVFLLIFSGLSPFSSKPGRAIAVVWNPKVMQEEQ
jgi:hypothetical protein